MALSLKNNMDLRGFIIYWRIENFSRESSPNLSIISPKFKIKALKSKWTIMIVEKNNYLGVYLRKETNPICCEIHYSLSYLKCEDWIPVLTNAARKFKSGGNGYGADIVSLENLNEEKWTYLPNGSLTIGFRIWMNKLTSAERSQCLMISRFENKSDLYHRPIEYFTNLKPKDLLSFPPSYEFQSNEQTPLQAGSYSALPPVPSLLFPMPPLPKAYATQLTQTDTNDDFKDTADLLRMFKEKDFSFVTLRTPDRDFLVHKAVLCAKSPVFNAMFERKMKENNNSCVEIDDIDSQTISSLIQFLHFQPLDNLKWESSVTLYYAADKYQIEVLKKVCVDHLKQELSVENICDALLLADLHQDMELKSCTQEYFCRNSKLILITKQWRDFLCHTDLVAEILFKLAQRM